MILSLFLLGEVTILKDKQALCNHEATRIRGKPHTMLRLIYMIDDGLIPHWRHRATTLLGSLLSPKKNNHFVDFHSKKYFIYLFSEREKGRRNRGRETSMCGCLSHAPKWGPGPPPRHVP